jgi:hypothetical protein
MSGPTVFISYSHQDEAWKDRLVTHLGVLKSEGVFELWDDRQISAGDGWRADRCGFTNAMRTWNGRDCAGTRGTLPRRGGMWRGRGCW